MSTTLTVNAVNYNQSARKTNALLVDGWGWDLDGDWFSEFHEYAAGPQPQFAGPLPVSLTIGGTTVFTGQIISVEPTYGAQGRTWGYRAMGLQLAANWIAVTATDGSGLMLFNVSPTDMDNYFPATAGQTVGQILSAVLTQHAGALTAAGITTDATTTSQLAALTLVPNEQVEIAGERLWQAMQSVLQRWARNMRLIILPTGLVRCVDVTTGSAHNLTVGTDPIDPPLFSRNWTHCATKVTVRGKGVIEPAYISQLRGTFTPVWSGANQTAWKWSDFTNPPKATDKGTITTVGGPTQVTVQSSDASLTWAANYWSSIQAWIYCIKTSGSGLTYTEARPITANAALTAGGTATITLGYDLTNAGASAYDAYQIIGTNVPLASGGLADVWRLYNVTDPGAWISAHLVRNFPVEVPFVDYFGTTAVLTSTPTCQIVKNGTAAPALFTVDPVHGQILFTRPVVENITTSANLILGGAHVAIPDDIYMLLAYSRGALTTSFPASGYSGTAYTAAGLSRTLWVDVESWRYGGNTSLMTGLATMLQQSVRDTLMEGIVRYKGFYATVQDPTGGHLLNFPATGYTSGDSALNIPVRAVTYRYLNEGGGLNYTTEIKCSTRQDPRTGESFYTHLSQLGSGISLQSYGSAGRAGSIPELDTTGLGPGEGAEIDMASLGGGGQRREQRIKEERIHEARIKDFRNEDQEGAMPAGGKYESLTARKHRKAKEKQDEAGSKAMFDRMMPSSAGHDLTAAQNTTLPGGPVDLGGGSE